MPKVFVKPASDIPVKHESGKFLDPQGETVDQSVWWKRRELDGDVVITDAPAEVGAPTSAADEKPAKK